MITTKFIAIYFLSLSTILELINCDNNSNSNVVTFSPYKNKSVSNVTTIGLEPRPKRQSTNGTCSLTPMSTEGPYYLKDVLERRDITDGKPGIPLNLTINVMDSVNSCKGLPGLRVDIWHCDALGVYSGVGSLSGRGGRRSGFRSTITTSISPVDRFLRGYQISDSIGQVNFQTIVPGWYPGRPIHIHFEIYLSSGKLLHVGQLYFDELLSTSLETIKPYSDNQSKRVPNNVDRIFSTTSGHKTIITLTGEMTSGMNSQCGIGLDLRATVPIQLVGGFNGGGGGRGFGRRG
ncbi:uncharacterized protein LOC128397163 [Panonychus citri]|uniref:uncharacterized protein LOC128397163 n=1 Tax=Panonychus citri TaxID=50023 RepID=UPI002307CAE5|nr:uncharacterized protein LOC128397163 [Panonychus citri]